MFWAEEYIEEKNFVHSCCVYKTQHGRTRYKFPITIRMCTYVVSISVFESAMSICILRWKKKYSVQNFFPNNYYACYAVRCVVFRHTGTTC